MRPDEDHRPFTGASNTVALGSRRAIAPAFTQRALGGVAWVVIVSVASFSLLGTWLTRRVREQGALEQARLIAAGLEVGPRGDLSRSIMKVLERCDAVLAVATLDATGALHTVYPERPAHRHALDEVRQSLMPHDSASSPPAGAAFVSVADPLTGEPTAAVGAVVSINGAHYADARRMAVLFRSDSGGGLVMTAVSMFAAPVAAAGLVSLLSLTGWFRRRVAGPLHDMAAMASGPRGRYGRRRSDRPTAWRETSELATLFDELLHGLAQSDAERRRLKLEAERSLAAREREYERRLRNAHERAFTDGVTRLRNRSFLEDQLECIFMQAQKADADLSAVLIDLDHFKRHNDTYGHQAGDQLLRFVGALLKGAVRPEDYAIRYGGDEFVLLLPGCNGMEARAIAERILKLFGQYARRMGKAVHVSLSAGVACLRTDGAATGHELIAQADAALYAAKRVGRNTVASVQSCHPSASRAASPGNMPVKAR